MESIYNNTTVQNNSKVRLGLAIVGIVAAIICSLTLLYETRSLEHSATVSPSIKSLNIMPALSVDNAGTSIISAVWPVNY